LTNFVQIHCGSAGRGAGGLTRTRKPGAEQMTVISLSALYVKSVVFRASFLL
jgi:hypothetical protein